MSYIYKITNKCNGRSYIGQTSQSLNVRWMWHLKESKRERSKNRPLYKAINKYGAENFCIEQVELCDKDISFAREIFWIAYFDTFRNGYNATYGGAGRHTIDYMMVYETYKKLGCNCKKSAETLSIDPGQVSTIVRALTGIEKLENPQPQSKRVDMYLLNDEYVRTFSSTREAARYTIKNRGGNIENTRGIAAHIADVCCGKRKTAQGYIWRFAS